MNCVVQQKKNDKKNDELSCNSILDGMSILVPHIHVNVEIHLRRHEGQLDSLVGKCRFLSERHG